MSLANYLNTNKILTTEQIELTQEPNELGDGARISDTIVYKGNATYSLNPPTTTLIGANQDFTPLFYDASGVSPPVADYLNVRPDEDLFNFQQLATIRYSVYVNSHSTFDFEYRIAFYDDELQRISANEAIVYDPSNNARDPPSIDGFTITGWSVEIPASARYAFLEVKNNTSGSIELQFDYGNSQLENAVDNSVVDNLLGSRPSTNIFTSDYYVSIRDISGVERDLSIIEAEITQLQNDVSGIEVEIEDISNGYLKLSGGTITGDLTLESELLGKRIISKEDIIITDTNGGAKGRLTQADNKFFIQSADGGELIVFSEYDQASSVLDIDTSNNILNTENVAIKTTDYADLNTQVKSNENQVNTNTGNINSITTSLSALLPKSGGTMTGSINMNGTHRIQNSAPPTAIGDLTNKQYVDGNITSAIGDLSNNISNTYLPLSGGTITGNLDIEGVIILEERISFIDDKIKIGDDAGITNQGQDTIAIGTEAGFQNQGAEAVAIGIQTGSTNQGAQTVAIGSGAGRTTQNDYGIAIGAETGNLNQGSASVALGQSAGYQNQGEYSIAVGAKAGFQDQSANSIALNATNIALNPPTSGLYVKPVRNATTSDALYYDATSGEISYGDISNTYLPLSGGTLNGELTVDDTILAEELKIKDANGNIKGKMGQQNNRLYIESGDGDSIIRFSKYNIASKVVDIDTANNILDTDAVAIKTTDYADLNAQVKSNENALANIPSSVSLPFSQTQSLNNINLINNGIFTFDLPSDFDHTKNYVSLKCFLLQDSPTIPVNTSLELAVGYSTTSPIQNIQIVKVFTSIIANTANPQLMPIYIEDMYFNNSNPLKGDGSGDKGFAVTFDATLAQGLTNVKGYITMKVERVTSTNNYEYTPQSAFVVMPS